MSVKKGVHATYDHERDMWIVDVPFGLNEGAMAAIQSFLVRRWTAEVAVMSLGDKRDRCLKGLAAARAGRLQQRMTHKGDQDFFKSTQRENPTRAFSFPSMLPSLSSSFESTLKE